MWVAVGMLCGYGAQGLGLSATAFADERVLSLSQLTQHTLRAHPSIDAAEAALVAAEATYREARFSPFFQFEVQGLFSMAPQASGTSVFSPDRQLPISNPWGPVLGAAVSGVVPLYTFGKIRSAWKAGKAGIAAAKAARTLAEQKLAFQLRQAFFGYQFAVDTLYLLEEGSGKVSSALKIAKEGSEARGADRYRLSLAAKDIEARLFEARRAKAVAEQALVTLSRLAPSRFPDCPSEPVPYEPLTSDAYLEASAQHRPELIQLREAITARRAELTATRAHLYPDIALTMRASTTHTPGITDQNNPFIIDNGNFRTLNAALIARWSLDILGNKARSAEKAAKLKEVEAQTQAAEEGIAIQVRDTFESWVEAHTSRGLWEDGAKEMRQWMVSAGQGYEVGAADSRDLLDAVKAYFEARFKLLTAIFSGNTALARLENVVGEALIPEEAWDNACRVEAEVGGDTAPFSDTADEPSEAS